MTERDLMLAVVEAGSFALHGKLNRGPYMMPPDVLDDAVHACFRAFLSAFQAAGYMIVPRSPSEAMLEVATGTATNRLIAEAFYRAMTTEGELK